MIKLILLTIFTFMFVKSIDQDKYYKTHPEEKECSRNN